MEIAAGIASKIGEYLVGATVHQVRYLFCFNSIVDDLKNEEINLKSAEDRIKREVEREKRNTKEPEKDVEKWLVDVDNAVADIQRLKEDIQANKSTCLDGWCPNWGWRYRSSRKAAKMTGILVKLRDRGKFNTVAHLKPLQSMRHSAQVDFMSFGATKLASDQIIEALKDEKTKMVGLYGIGGAGKTTLANMVRNEVQEKEIFHEVVKAVVKQNPNLINIQDELACSLGLTLEEKSSLEERAKRLHLRFTGTDKKILIILDDVWAKLDLATVGIPSDSDHMSCKILITTRSLRVCIAMGCLRIPLSTLNEKEGLALLKIHAGIDDSDSSMIDVAKEVARECKGLPLAIVTVGGALKEKGVNEWKAVSRKLKNSKLVDVEDVDADVYACLKLSYDYLKGENTKLVFLLCSLFPEDYNIRLEDLVRYGIGFGLFEDADTIEDARNELHLLANNLKDCCLLLDAGDQFVKMHDIVRDVALWIASKGKNVFMGKAGNGLTEWPKKDGLDHHTAISLMNNNITVLPSDLVCPKLEILLVGGYYQSKVVVPDQFFKEMKALKVLTIIEGELSLESLEFLENIRTVQLIKCTLSDMSSLRKLKSLRILCIRDSSFVCEISEVLGDLDELRVLELHDTDLPLSVMKRFPRLEEFYGNIKLKEVQLEQTSSEINSELCFVARSLDKSAECFPHDFAFSKLRRYQIKVNDDRPGDLLGTTALRIKNIEATSLNLFKALYRNLQYFGLINAICYQNIVPSIDQEGFNELNYLELCDCDELEYIIDTSQQEVPVTAFSNLTKLYLMDINRLTEICYGANYPRRFLENLEILYVIKCHSVHRLLSGKLLRQLQKLRKVKVKFCNKLQEVFQSHHEKESDHVLLICLAKLNLKDLRELKWIWKGPINHVSLQNLTNVKVTECPSLAYIFSVSLAKSLVQLEKLQVRNCQSLKHIVFDNNDGGGNEVVLRMLSHLQLEELPNLISFYSENHYLTWPALRKLKLRSCPNLAIEPELEANVHNFTENLEFLSVDDCDHLGDAIPAMFKHGLKNLEKLTIGKPFGIQVVFQIDANVADRQGGKISLPSLKELKLKCLSEQEVLCKGPTPILSLQNLTSLTLKDCSGLRYIFSSALARILIQLEKLRIEDCEELEQIIVDEDDDDDADDSQIISSTIDHPQHVYFPKLKYLKVERCSKLKRLFHVDIARGGLQELREIRICDNKQLEEVFGQKDEAPIRDNNEIVWGKLWHLSLTRLPSFTNVCPIGYHFIFPSMKFLRVSDCPMICTRFSTGQTDTVHAEAGELQSGEGDIRAQLPSAFFFNFGNFRGIREALPPYREK